MKVVSLFSGAGGMDLGFTRAGHKIVWANDIWSEAAATYRLNLGDHIVLGDLREITTDLIPDADLVIGGFPCQGFSVANMKRHADDDRNALYLEFLRVIRDKQPAYFVAENVKGLLTLAGGAVFALIVDDFAQAGYSVTHALLNAADYGVPQRRERVFIVGTRVGRSPVPFPPAPTHSRPEWSAMLQLRPWITSGEALREVPDPDGAHALENHEYTKYKLRFNGYLGHRATRGDEPAPTITARGDDRGGVVIHHHPNNLRRLSAREVALLQSFPLDYHFFGTKTSVYRQVANAVPPRLAEAVAGVFPSTTRQHLSPTAGVPVAV